MAEADYRLCDVCQRKVFYDANLNYGDGEIDDRVRNGGTMLIHQTLDHLGDWVVICKSCAKTHEIALKEKQ